MLLITCPVCAISADETEFTCGGPYAQDGPQAYRRGVVREWWLCEAGCGTWFGMARHNGNHRIFGCWTRGNEPPAFPEETP